MADEEPQFTEKPTDRLTRLANEVTAPLNELPDVKAVLMLQDGQRGGIVLHGYDEPSEAIADLYFHFRAVCRANGMELEMIAVPDSPEGI